MFLQKIKWIKKKIPQHRSLFMYMYVLAFKLKELVKYRTVSIVLDTVM